MSCKYCAGARQCGEILTLDLKVQGGNGSMENRYEIYECTRERGHIGGHIACWDDPEEKDPMKRHKSKAFVGAPVKKGKSR